MGGFSGIPYRTSLGPDEEDQFQGWVKGNKIPWQDTPTADYDMRGFWKAQQAGQAQRTENQHFPDTYKTPYHHSFSDESMYATPDAPHWVGDNLEPIKFPMGRREAPALNASVSIPTPSEAARPLATSSLPSIKSPQRASDEAELQRMESSGSGIQQVQQKHGVAGGFLRGLDILGSALAPGITAAIPGTSLHHNFEVTAQRRNVAQDVGEEQKQAQTGLETAQAQAIPQELDLKRQALNQKQPKEQNQLDLAHLYAQALENGDQAGAEKYRQGIVALEQPKLDAASAKEAASERHQQAQEDLTRRGQNMTDSRARDLNKIARDTKAQEKAKPTADEQRRADLAENMEENLNSLEEILNRRGDLFGPVAGRMTQGKQWFGTGDPDVSSLKAIREYLGMASVGAHAMRNAQHVGTAADAVMAGFVNSPEATKAAIQQARKSIQTFKDDIKRSKGELPEAGAPSAGPQATHRYNPATGTVEAIQ